jgi:hypothetical protein
MKFISHRGNIEKKNNKKENDPDYILTALEIGFDVEIDFRVNNSKLYLGHDFSQFEINENFIKNFNKKLWIHAKNKEALIYLNNSKVKYNFFWHQGDSFTITSRGYIWTHSKAIRSLTKKNKILNNTICTLPEISKINKNKLNIFYGICSDSIIFYKNI